MELTDILLMNSFMPLTFSSTKSFMNSMYSSFTPNLWQQDTQHGQCSTTAQAQCVCVSIIVHVCMYVCVCVCVYVNVCAYYVCAWHQYRTTLYWPCNIAQFHNYMKLYVPCEVCQILDHLGNQRQLPGCLLRRIFCMCMNQHCGNTCSAWTHKSVQHISKFTNLVDSMPPLLINLQ